MKKKIIPIILTAVMVLTMLPALALPTKAENPHKLTVTKSGGTPVESGDYEWNENQLIIKTNGLIVSGETKEEVISIDDSVDNITLKGVKIIPENPIETVINSNSTDLTIKLVGENQIGNKPTKEKASNVTFGILNINGNLTIIGNGKLSIYAEGVGMASVSNLTIGDETKITAEVKGGLYDGFQPLTGNNIIIEGKAELTVITKEYSVSALFALNNITISSEGPIKLISEKSVAALVYETGKIEITDNVKEIIMCGSQEDENGKKTGAIYCCGTVKVPSGKCSIFGDVVNDYSNIDVEKMVEAYIDDFEYYDGEYNYNIQTSYVKKDGKSVPANVLVIKAIEEPENPETKDTNSMLIWAIAGLASLAIAAGILVSKKQKN